MKNNTLIVAILILIAGGLGFFGGMKYQQARRPSRLDFQAMRGMRQGDSGAQGFTGPQAVRGEIIDKGETSVTVKLPDDSSKIILISENTIINKATKGSVDDLETGEQVMVFGQTNSDGSLSASDIQLGADFRFR